MGGPGGGGILNWLSNAVGGGGSLPAPNPTAAPGGAAPAAGGVDPTGGMGAMPPMPKPGLLDNPLLQGALATYFGAIGSPKQGGWGEAIAHGGLAGLGAYQQAKSAQYQPYLMGAQLAHLQSQTQLEQAQTKKAGAQAEQIAGYAKGNQVAAQQLFSMEQQATNPQEKQMWHTLGVSVAASTKPVDMSTLLKDPYEALKSIQETQKAGVETQEKQFELSQLDPAKLQHEEAGTQSELASAAHSNVGTALEKLKVQQQPAEYMKTMGEAVKNLGTIYDADHRMDMGAMVNTQGYQQARQKWIGDQLRAAGVNPKGPQGQMGTGRLTPGMHGAAQQQGLTVGPDGVARDVKGNPYQWQPDSEGE